MAIDLLHRGAGDRSHHAQLRRSHRAGSRRPESGSRPPKSTSAASTTRSSAMRRGRCVTSSTTTRQRGDAVFLVYEDERWTFAEFASKVDALAAALVDRYKIAKGDRVAIGMRNYPEWVVAFSAITSIGAISVSLNAWWTTDELDYAPRRLWRQRAHRRRRAGRAQCATRASGSASM